MSSGLSGYCGFDLSNGLIHIAETSGDIRPFYLDLPSKTFIPCRAGDLSFVNMTSYTNSTYFCFAVYTNTTYWIGVNKTFCDTKIPMFSVEKTPSSSNTNKFSVKIMMFLLFIIWVVMCGL
ncbi:hypothetical protein BB559_007265 [Furculomyces boomerangus]|uniref:Uncharacterized protein n=2 Tax=Harpellales TaxID=61421 RepID=A0A2T9XY17_9FUNG|nr:hypothetical protein BB559_007265 [Furculomyces boomerangus]PWA02670.1 hypothetical protein BB558_001185 [Smittium angustum]